MSAELDLKGKKRKRSGSPRSRKSSESGASSTPSGDKDDSGQSVICLIDNSHMLFSHSEVGHFLGAEGDVINDRCMFPPYAVLFTILN